MWKSEHFRPLVHASSAHGGQEWIKSNSGAGNSVQPSTWMAGIQLPEPSRLPPRMWESGAGARYAIHVFCYGMWASLLVKIVWFVFESQRVRGEGGRKQECLLSIC